ncbi:unnamed protein product [Mytilus coruscus]|uniref:Transposase Helix-turn-helix domain-containing protein n=1 Tax=Mytilus coruscus TaxID=42192 RepID=A0A6J8DGU1_MYTCO|nr:unnamed protein product [Mytilus coruscus]
MVDKLVLGYELFVDEDEDNTLKTVFVTNNSMIEILFFLMPTRRPILPRIQGYTEKVLPTFLSEDYRTHFRVSKELFEQILEKIEPKLIFVHRSGHEQISPYKQLLLFLCYMANMETFRELGHYFGIGRSTVHKCITLVLDVFIDSFIDVIRWPSPQRQNEIAQEI